MLNSSPGSGQERQNPLHGSNAVAITSNSSSGGLQFLNSSPSKRKSGTMRLDLQDNDNVATTAKRAKIGSEPSTKESIYDAGLILSLKEVKTQGVNGGVGDTPKNIRQTQPLTDGNSESVFSRFYSAIRSFSLFDSYSQPRTPPPDFGEPDESADRAVESGSKPEMVVPGGPRKPSSTYRNQNKKVRSGPDRPDRLSSPTKAFDLTSPYVSLSLDRGTEHAPKRRKTGPSTLDESYDELQYVQTRNQISSSRPIKTVSSNIPPLERKDPRDAFAVREFKSVESTMCGRGRRRSSQNSRPPSNQSSREATLVIDDDEIQESSVEVARPSRSYTGTANLVAARTRDERRRVTNNRQHIQTGLKSKYFPAQSSSNANTQDAGTAGSAPRRTSNWADNPRQTGVQHGLDRGSVEDISDEELYVPKPGLGSKRNHRGGVMAGFAKNPPSASISRDGDIQSSLPRQLPRKAPGKAGAPRLEQHPSFPVTYLRSALEIFDLDGDDEPWYLQFKPESSRMVLIGGGVNFPDKFHQYRSFTFDPTSVKKIISSDDNSRIILWVTESNTTTGVMPKLLLKLDGEEAYNFVTYLRGASDAVAHRYERNKMDRIFEETKKKYDKWRQRHDQEDVKLLERNRNGQNDERRQPQPGDTVLTKNGKRPENFDSSMQPPRTKKLHQRLRNESSDNELSKSEVNDIENQRREEPREQNTRRQTELNRDDHDIRPTTRSTRGQNREARRTSPPPSLRWTDQHTNWEAFWAGDDSLVFPFGGTKQAPVDRRDIERLDEGEFLNDNLIAFYLRYLEDKTERERPEVSKRVFFMNTFFYPRLTRGKGRKNIDYDAVKRWTSKVNIFDYDYIVVPVNENAHWYVAIICNAPKLLHPAKDRPSQADEQAEVHEKDVVDLDESTNLVSPAPLKTKNNGGSISPDMTHQVSGLSIEDTVDSEQESNRANHRSRKAPGRQNQVSPSHITIADDDKDHSQKVTSSPFKGRKGKRKSLPPVRKYNTNDPRIITLDSLGLAHSPTCSNLREFLILEAKEKLGVEITLAQPSIGMTAKNIPEQNNFCDCGLFLLGYIEGFLDHPDETIHGIMQGKTDMKNSFPKMNATDMRNSMRDLIFSLRREQVVKEHAAKSAKLAAKKATTQKEEEPLPETKEMSSVSTSPKPAVTSKQEYEIVDDSPPASEANRVPEEPSVLVVDIVEEEQPSKDLSSSTGELSSVNAFMDDLSGFKDDAQEAKESIEDSPLHMYRNLEDLPENAGRLAIRGKTPPCHAHKQAKHKQGLNIMCKGLKPKHPTPEPEQRGPMHRRHIISPRLRTPPRRSPSPHLQDHIDLVSNASEDSLRVSMSQSLRRRNFSRDDVHEIPDSQSEDAERGRAQNVDKDSSGDRFEDLMGGETRPFEMYSPMARAGAAAAKRHDEQATAKEQTGEASVKKQARMLGARSAFHGSRREGKKGRG